MSPTETQNDSTTKTDTTRKMRTDHELVSYRIEIDGTDRALLQGFHLGAQFWPTRDAQKVPWIAEFGDPAIATQVIAKLAYSAPLLVRRKDWGELEGPALLHLCCRVEKTGAHTNMLFWSPTSSAARAYLGVARQGQA